MTKKEALQLFEEKKIRSVWDDKEEKWYFSIVDVCAVLTEQPDAEHARNYWKVLKHRLIKEGNQTVTTCNRLKLRAADGKLRLTDVADTEQLFRLIQSVPSPKAEPFKRWMAQVASTRLEQMQDPEKSIDQAVIDYKRLGYSDAWINQRIKSIEIRKELTDEWARTGVQQGMQYASLTDIITREWSGMSTKQYKQFKGLKKESLRDNMTIWRLRSICLLRHLPQNCLNSAILRALTNRSVWLRMVAVWQKPPALNWNQNSATRLFRQPRQAIICSLLKMII